MELNGSRVLVTGAALRVGREIALELARAGADLFVHYHSSRAEAEAVAGEIADMGRRAVLVQGDQRVPADVTRMGKECRSADVLVNSASVFPRTPLDEVTSEEWDDIHAANLRGPFFLARDLGLAMKERGRGVIVNIADWAGYRPYKGYLPYCISKAGLLAMNAGLARALAPEVRVNAIAPGPVLLPEDMGEKERQTVLSSTPLGREGTPGDVARSVRFLVEGSDFITGAVLTVDGGRLIS